MPRAEWCGKECCDCENPCYWDENYPCSPCCELLGKDGRPIDHDKCRESGCDAIEIVEEYEGYDVDE